MKPESERWLQMADYDLGVADLCYQNQVYIYCVFFCHLSLEKLLKAVLLERLGLEEPPHTHNLYRLAELGIMFDLPENYMDFLRDLTPHSTMARYPEGNYRYNEEGCGAIFSLTQEVYSWLTSRLT